MIPCPACGSEDHNTACAFCVRAKAIADALVPVNEDLAGLQRDYNEARRRAVRAAAQGFGGP